MVYKVDAVKARISNIAKVATGTEFEAGAEPVKEGEDDEVPELELEVVDVV